MGYVVIGSGEGVLRARLMCLSGRGEMFRRSEAAAVIEIRFWGLPHLHFGSRASELEGMESPKWQPRPSNSRTAGKHVLSCALIFSHKKQVRWVAANASSKRDGGAVHWASVEILDPPRGPSRTQCGWRGRRLLQMSIQ